ncbi:hypothetical protein APSETT445_000023 [Aspergillus pseudonomiae]
MGCSEHFTVFRRLQTDMALVVTHHQLGAVFGLRDGRDGDKWKAPFGCRLAPSATERLLKKREDIRALVEAGKIRRAIECGAIKVVEQLL